MPPDPVDQESSGTVEMACLCSTVSGASGGKTWIAKDDSVGEGLETSYLHVWYLTWT